MTSEYMKSYLTVAELELVQCITEACLATKVFRSSPSPEPSSSATRKSDLHSVTQPTAPTPSAPPRDSDRISLNVGGQRFSITKNALFRGESHEMFGCLFSLDTDVGLCLKEKDAHGAYLLDRCPTYVEPVLEYLQNGRLLLNDKVSYLGVIEEAKFFGVDELIPDIQRRMMGCDLTAVDLSQLDLHLLDFRGANLSMCNLEHADLSHSDFEGAQLYGAKMMYANLEGADFRSCKMGGPRRAVVVERQFER
ncbi:hypothetical protein MRX96_021815 [Rhipicephalus microplus]